MTSPFDDIDFLSRSPSRFRVLKSICEAPRTRHELKQEADASRTTLSRMLADFEDREWITRADGQYRLTPTGEVVVSEVHRLLENLETAKQLNGSLQWLPTDDFDFELHRIQDAEVATVQWNDPASIRELAGHLEGAHHVKSVAAAVSREVVDVLRMVTVEQAATYEGILAPEAVDVIQDHPDLRSQLTDMIALDQTTLYEYQGDDSLPMVMVIDDLASICNHSSDGPYMEAVLSSDEAFHEWCDAYFESVRAEAEPLTLGAFAQ